MVSIWPPSRRATLRAEPLPNIRRRTDLKTDGVGARNTARPEQAAGQDPRAQTAHPIQGAG